MRTNELGRLVARDLRRTRGALSTAGFGILAGTAVLLFFLSLGLGVRAVLLGDVFPLDKIELEPVQSADPGLLSLVLGSSSTPRIAPEEIDKLESMPEVRRVYPKLRVAFPCSARGGKAILGHDVGSSEMIADGVDPALVAPDVHESWTFQDPWEKPGKTCSVNADCKDQQYCEQAPGAIEGRCVNPVPVLVSRYLIELFNKGIAPAHGLPPVGASLLERANGITFTMRLGESLLGASNKGRPRTVRGRVVGMSSRAIDLGLTFPINTVRRWNEEYVGKEAGRAFTSVLIETRGTADASAVMAKAASLGLSPKDTNARDVSILVNCVTALLSLVASVILMMAASNIAYSFRALLHERRSEIGLYRAVGATRGDIVTWLLTLAAVVGTVYAVVGVALGWLAMLAADWLAATRIPDFPFKPDSFFELPWWLALATIAFGALFAVLGAVGPARKAAAADPRDYLLG